MREGERGREVSDHRGVPGIGLKRVVLVITGYSLGTRYTRVVYSTTLQLFLANQRSYIVPPLSLIHI